MNAVTTILMIMFPPGTTNVKPFTGVGEEGGEVFSHNGKSTLSLLEVGSDVHSN
jgi:hypothetical protein